MSSSGFIFVLGVTLFVDCSYWKSGENGFARSAKFFYLLLEANSCPGKKRIQRGDDVAARQKGKQNMSASFVRLASGAGEAME